MKEGFFFYLVKRFFLALFTFFVILGASYFLMRLAPGDPAKSTMFGEGKEQLSADKVELAQNNSLREKLHLDKPIHVGFFLWLKGVCKGDFGESASVDKGRPVLTIILEHLPNTLKLNILAIFLTYAFAIPMGIFSATKPDSKWDTSLSIFLFFLFSLPVLWSALMLQALFCKGGLYPVFPLKGLSPAIVAGMSTWEIAGKSLMHYVLPVICLSYGSFAALARFTRGGMLEVIQEDYIRTARSKGAGEFTVICHHAFRNALILMITLFAGLLPSLVGGSILVEYIFNIPGMGSLSMLALSSRDLPLMMALFAISGFLTLAGIFIADILYVLADPRIDFRSRV